tara:strand:- start:1189 stop:1395 length:207 start_codon:yes stop_codon:yes gene_type:complete
LFIYITLIIKTLFKLPRSSAKVTPSASTRASALDSIISNAKHLALQEKTEIDKKIKYFIELQETPKQR